MQSAFREDSHLMLGEMVADDTCAVLRYVLSDELAHGDDINLGRSRVSVGCVEAEATMSA